MTIHDIDLPFKNCDFLYSYIYLPEGITVKHHESPLNPMKSYDHSKTIIISH